MFKKILFFNFILSSFLGLCIYIVQKLGMKLPWFINNYINDFLIIPIVLSICMFLLRWLRNDNTFKIPVRIIIYVIVFYSVFFEFLMPKLLERYTTDIVDVLMYSLGGLWFWLLQQNSMAKNKYNKNKISN